MSFIAKFGVSSRIGAVVAWLGLSLIVVAVFSYERIETMNEYGKEVSVVQAPKVKRSLSVQSKVYEMNVDLLNHFLTSDAEVRAALESTHAQDQAEILALMKAAVEANTGDARTAWEAALEHAKLLDGLYEQMFALSRVDKDTDALLIYDLKYKPMVAQILDLCAKRVSFNSNALATAADALTATGASAKTNMLIVAGLAIALGIAMAFVVVKSIKKTIDDATSAIEGLQQNATEVATASTQIARSSEQLSQATTEQAAALQETSASIEQMSSMVQKNSDNARRSVEVSGNSRRSAEQGNQVVGEMIRSIGEIDQSNQQIMAQINESNARISDIVKVIGEIGNRTKVINDIVFQTKLLSFNASVEAARAGEHGKGFAVVAEEVGNLARMSGEAAKEISSMLESSIQKVEGIVSDTTHKVGSLVAEGRKKVENGSVVARQCGDVLREIVEGVTQVTRMSQEISGACDEQSQGIREITRAVSQLDQVTQQNAAASEECAAAAEQLSAQTETMRNVVTRSVQMIRGSSSNEVSTHTSAPAPVPQSYKPARPDGHVLRMDTFRASAKETNTAQRRTSGAGPAATSNAGQWKKAAGAENVPDENDPRFQDV